MMSTGDASASVPLLPAGGEDGQEVKVFPARRDSATSLASSTTWIAKQTILLYVVPHCGTCSAHRHRDSSLGGRSKRKTIVYAVCTALALLAFALGYHPDARDAALGYAQAWTPMSLEDKEQIAKLADLKQVLDERFEIDFWHTGRYENAPALDRLIHCISTKTCRKREKKVVILGSHHFGNALAGRISGEDIWARSTIAAYTALNYTRLYSYSSVETLTMYQAMPDLVQVVIWEGASGERCVERNETNYLEMPVEEQGEWQTGKKACIKKEGYEIGIPIWKTFAFHFWRGKASRLGLKWTLSPEDYGEGSYYLGYSLEDRCKKIDFQEFRYHRAMILAKRPDYFEAPNNLFPGLMKSATQSVPHEIDPLTNKEVPFTVIATAGHSAADGIDPLVEPGVISLGAMNQHEWWDAVAKSKVLVGIGRPPLSPSPYDALCFGVPFINPISSRREAEPDNRFYWDTQHNGLRFTEPPYVYHVSKGNLTELSAAMQAAVATPIGRYIPPAMTLDAVQQRHEYLMEHDWYAEAEATMSELWPDGDAPFML